MKNNFHRTAATVTHYKMRSDQSFDRSSYPLNIPAIKDLQSLGFHSDATFFFGENGSGKSTLIEAIVSDVATRKFYWENYLSTSALFYQEKSGFDEPPERIRLVIDGL